MKDKYIKLDDCIHGNLYKINARNFNLGVYTLGEQGFLGIRYKFGSEFLALEYHWDFEWLKEKQANGKENS